MDALAPQDLAAVESLAEAESIAKAEAELREMTSSKDDEMSKSILEKLDLKVTKVPFSLEEKLEKGAFSIDENFVVNIGNIHDLFDSESRQFKRSMQNVFKNISSQVAYVSEVINCWATSVNTRKVAARRLKNLLFYLHFL